MEPVTLSPPPLSPPRYEETIYVGKHNERKQETPEPEPETEPVFEFKIELSSIKVALNVINTLTHFFLGAIVFGAFTIANSGIYSNGHYRSSTPFSIHIYFCVIGYVVLMSQAILSFNTHGGWAHGFKYPQKKKIHSSMQIGGSLLAICGCIVKIACWDYYAPYNLGHVITGWIAMLLTFLSLIGGYLNFKHADKIRESRYKNWHKYLGFLTLSMAFLCLCLGFGDWDNYYGGNASAALSIMFTVFAFIGILIAAVHTKIY